MDIVVIGSSDIFEILESAFAGKGYRIIGYISPQKEESSTYPDYEFLGNDDNIEKYAPQGCKFVLAVGDNLKRELIFKKIKALQGEVLSVRHPSSVVLGSAQIGEGALIAPLSIVSAKAQIGCSVMVCYQSLVGHDVKIGDFSFVAPGARILNRVETGSQVFIGANAVILPRVRIGNHVKIAANTTISKNIGDNSIIMNSARILKIR